MDTPASPLILTKLRVPTARSRNIPRARLVDRLSQENRKGLVLVSAPAGYGKTTLLVEWAQFCAKNGTAVAWYALDPVDDDPPLFSSYLIASLIQALGPLPELAQTAQLLRFSTEVDLQRILPAVINALVSNGQDCVLILDDYHLISAPAIHSAVAYLLHHLPENLRVAIGSRSDPPLPLARLRAGGQLVEVRAPGLRFTVDETALFLNRVMGLDLPPAMVTALETRTEGWVAGLQLAALALSANPPGESADGKGDFFASFTGSHRYLVDYLLDEVVNRQPEQVQAFLLSTSILERMCAPLCDAVTGESASGEAILKHLEQSNLFVVALDAEGRWFRYHHLFRDFLQDCLLKTLPERVSALRRAASAWYERNGYLREAAEQAIKDARSTHDWEYAAAFVEKNSFTMIIHSDIATIYDWCSAFPEEIMARHPLLCVHQCWALVFSFRRQNRDRVEARLRQVDKMLPALKDSQGAGEIKDIVSIIRTFMAMAPDPFVDAREHLAQAQKMLGDYPEEDPGQFSGLLMSGYAYMALHDAQAATQVLEKARQAALRGGLFFGIVESTFHLSRAAFFQGQLRKAAEVCLQGQARLAALLARPDQELPALGSLDIALGCVLLEQDLLAEAEQHLLHGLEQIGLGTNPYYLMTACMALFRLREVQGRSKEALRYLDHLESAWPDIAFLTRGLRVTHALRTTPADPAALAEAAAWSQELTPSPGAVSPLPGMGPLGAAEVYYQAHLCWCRAQIASGRSQAAQPYVERQLELASSQGLAQRVIELLLVEAEMETGTRPERARAALERALALAQPEGMIRVFDQGLVLRRMLFETNVHENSRAFLDRIRAAISPGGNANPDSSWEMPSLPDQQYRESLSEREMEILRLMAGGATNQAIADQLVIAVGTVKSHINHILGKLGARNRTEAVALARERRLLN